MIKSQKRRKNGLSRLIGFASNFFGIRFLSFVNVGEILLRFNGKLDSRTALAGSVTRLGILGTLKGIAHGLHNNLLLFRSRYQYSRLFLQSQKASFATSSLLGLRACGGFENVCLLFSMMAYIAFEINENRRYVTWAQSVWSKICYSLRLFYNTVLLLTLIGGFIASPDLLGTASDLQAIFVVLLISKGSVKAFSKKRRC